METPKFFLLSRTRVPLFLCVHYKDGGMLPQYCTYSILRHCTYIILYYSISLSYGPYYRLVSL